MTIGGARELLGAIILGVAIIGCTPVVVNPTSSGPPGGSTDAAWQPPVQPLPSDPGYRERLGAYADLVLGSSALVPPGSPEHLAYLSSCIESAGFDVDIAEGGISTRPGVQESHFRDVMA